MGGAAVSGDEEEAEGTGRGQQEGEMAALRGGRLGEGIGREARVCVCVRRTTGNKERKRGCKGDVDRAGRLGLGRGASWDNAPGGLRGSRPARLLGSPLSLSKGKKQNKDKK